MRRSLHAAAGVALIAASLHCSRPAPPTPASPEPPVKASSAVDKAVATTGDVITFTVVVDYREEIQAEVPEPGADIAGLRIIDTGRDPLERVRDRRIERRWYKVRADLVGSYILPAVTVTYRSAEDATAEPTTLQTSEIFLEVKSVLPKEGEATDIRGLKPLVRSRHTPWLAIGGGAAGLALTSAAVFLLLLRRRRRVSLPSIPPHEIAYAAINELRKTDFSDREALRRYYFALSAVIRAYVEARFSLNATDLTTEEIQARIADLLELDAAQREALREFLRETDQVKFAAHSPSTEEVEKTYERALRFVESTVPVPEEQRGEQGGAR